MRTLYPIAQLRLCRLTVADASNVTSQHRVEPIRIAREFDVAQGSASSEGNDPRVGRALEPLAKGLRGGGARNKALVLDEAAGAVGLAPMGKSVQREVRAHICG